MKDINFLSQQNRELSGQQKKDALIFKYATMGFAAVVVVFVILFGTRLYFQYKLKNLQTQVDTVSQQIDSNQELEASYLFFIDKLKIIKQLFDQRSDKQIALSYFSSLFGPEITISGLTYNMEEGILSLRVLSPHVFFLEEAFGVLDDPNVTKHFVTLNKTNLSRTGAGEYAFSLTVTFKEDSDLVTEEKEY
jgi:hypothetical protein